MSIIIQPEFRKSYHLIDSKEYRVEGTDLFPCKVFTVTSAMMYLEEGTIVELYALNVNQSHPEMFKAFIPSMDAYIPSISFFSVDENN
jgi:hypothetical protein